MYGIELRSGVNLCYWNVGGKCTSPTLTHNLLQGGYCGWDLQQNCTLHAFGAPTCSGYRLEIILAANSGGDTQ